MRDFKCRRTAGMVLICFAAVLALLSAGRTALAAEPEEEEVKAAVETFLRNYEAKAMLDQSVDMTLSTVLDPALIWEPAGQAFEISAKTVTLEELRENISYLIQKAAYYAGMRRIQNIYREELRLTYTCQSLRMNEETARASVTETAEFYYTDSARPSVFEMSWRVDLVKLAGRWVVADASDGSGFDSAYKGKGPLDVPALLTAFGAGVQEENCVVSYPMPEEADPAGKIFYRGTDAAAYAYTYARPDADPDRTRFYNSQFKAYAGNGGDCMNFTSQCLWAGFGGSQTLEAIDGRLLPMDTEGPSTWYGRTAGGEVKDAEILSWISCSSFRDYLMNEESGSNLSDGPGLFATVLDLGENCPVSGVTAEELVGAAAHVSGSGGAYSHAVVLTAATGLTRGEIWFCSHTADISNIKLGDYYTGPLKIYIPRYLRLSGDQTAGTLRPERTAPVNLGAVKTIGFEMESNSPRRLTLSITAPGETEPQWVSTDGSACSTELEFVKEGLYQVDCKAEFLETGRTESVTYYIRCRANAERALPESGPELEEEAPEPPRITRESIFG